MTLFTDNPLERMMIQKFAARFHSPALQGLSL